MECLIEARCVNDRQATRGNNPGPYPSIALCGGTVWHCVICYQYWLGNVLMQKLLTEQCLCTVHCRPQSLQR